MRHESKPVAASYLLRATACITALVITVTAVRSFEAKFEADSAQEAQLIPLLMQSAKRNPDDAQSILNLADAMRKAGDSAGGLQILQVSSIGRNHWQGWQRQGVFWEGIASGPTGTTDDVNRAMAFFDRVARVHPYYIPALEHRGSLALKIKDWKKAAAIADELEQIDFNHLNANYLRSRLAVELRETTKALSLLRHLSDQRGYPSSLFTKDSLSVQIEILQREVEP